MLARLYSMFPQVPTHTHQYKSPWVLARQSTHVYRVVLLVRSLHFSCGLVTVCKVHMGQAIGTTIVKLTGGEGLGLG